MLFVIRHSDKQVIIPKTQKQLWKINGQTNMFSDGECTPALIQGHMKENCLEINIVLRNYLKLVIFLLFSLRI